MTHQDLDRELLSLRDRLELNKANGDHRFDWLLDQLRDRINQQAKQACEEGEHP